MEWHDTFIVKDAIKILNAAARGTSFTTSFQPKLLGKLCDVMLDCPERPEGHKFFIHPPLYEYKHVCLTSGGADSTIAYYLAQFAKGLYIDIGQPYATKELKALAQLEIPYCYIDMRGTHLADNRWQHIIPGRNFLFLCVAAEMLQDNGNIMFAMVDGEGAESDKGDKSLMFVEYFQDWYRACTGRRIFVQTMVDRTKAGWLKWFSEHHDVNIIRKNTVTCFSGEEGQCGSCQACLRKYLSFISIKMDIAEDFHNHPMVGARQYVEKYKKVLGEALHKQDFSHYSRQRCVEDLEAMAVAIGIRIVGRSV
jgi:7-cyano-7-deazaguanine synthase in queuosine biosynthesis